MNLNARVTKGTMRSGCQRRGMRHLFPVSFPLHGQNAYPTVFVVGQLRSSLHHMLARELYCTSISRKCRANAPNAMPLPVYTWAAAVHTAISKVFKGNPQYLQNEAEELCARS